MDFISKHLTKYSVITGIAVIVFLIICVPLSNNELSRLHIEHSTQAISDLSWYYVEGDESVILPFPVNGSGYETVTLTKVLPDSIPDDFSIMLNSCNSIIKVYIDDNEIFSYGENGGTVFGKMLTDLKCIVPIYPNYAGHTLTVTTTPVVAYNGKIPEIYFRNRSNQILTILVDNLWCIVFCSILSVMCFYALGLGLNKKRHGMAEGSNRLLYYALFSFTVIVYLYSNSDLPQLIIGYNEINSLITYLTLAYGTVPLMGIYKELIPSFRSVFSKIQFIGSSLVIINIVFYALHILLPSQLLICTQLLYLVISIVLLYASFAGHRSHELTLLNIGNSSLILIGLLSMVVYFLSPDKDWNVIILAASVLLFSIFLILEMISMDTKLLKEATTKDAIKSVAFIDPLTQLANRAALFRYANELKNMPAATTVIALIIDIDNLSQINDQLGNVAGDIMIQKAAECISNLFRNTGTVYRLEWDIFVTLIVNPKKKCIDYEEQLKNAILVNNRVTPYKLSISVGSALREIGTSSENFLVELVDEATDKLTASKFTF